MKSDWEDEAACKNLPSEYWVIADSEGMGKGNYHRNGNIAYGKKVCMDCPVQLQCLIDQMDWEEKNVLAGQARITVRGGLTGHERDEYARQSNGRWSDKSYNNQ